MNTEPFIDSVWCTDVNSPRATVRRCVVFSEEQACQAFAVERGPDLMLCVNDGRSAWVTNTSQAIEFFRRPVPDEMLERDFYELMQTYRHTPRTDQAGTTLAYEAIKAFIRSMF